MLELKSLFINLIIYSYLLLPLIILVFVKDIFTSKKNLSIGLAMSFGIESALSIVLYAFGKNIFSVFSHESGIINLSIFISKIIFLDSSLYGIKILIPRYLFTINKKTAILVLIKIAVSLVIYLIGYFVLSFTFFLYLFPICDIIYYIVLIKLFSSIN